MLLKDIAFEHLYIGLPVRSRVTGREGRICRISKADTHPLKTRNNEIEISWYDTSPSTVVSHITANTIEQREFLME